MNNKLRNKKGVTLIETVLYLSLFSIVFLVIIQFFFATTDLNNNVAIRNQFERDTIFLDEHINQSFKDTISLNEINTVFGSSSGVLSLNTNSGLLEYYLEDDRIYVDRSGISNPLTGSGYVVTNFLLNRVEWEDNSLRGINITIDLEDEKNNYNKSFNSNYML
jgi:type II secretory pathway pseudopilin PulG